MGQTEDRYCEEFIFGMQFLDKNGDLVNPNDDRYGFGVGWRAGLGNVGEVMKMDSYTPSESNMERVVRAKNRQNQAMMQKRFSAPSKNLRAESRTEILGE